MAIVLMSHPEVMLVGAIAAVHAVVLWRLHRLEIRVRALRVDLERRNWPRRIDVEKP